MIKYIKYLLVFLLATGFVACSEDEGAQILGSLYEKVDITPEPGMNLVGRVTDGTGPIEGVVVSDDLQMGGVSGRSLKERVRLAVLAGNDILLFGNNLSYDPLLHDKVFQALASLVREGRISPERVKASWRRIETMKRGLAQSRG